MVRRWVKAVSIVLVLFWCGWASSAMAARTWASLQGPEGGPIRALVTTSSGTLFAGAQSRAAGSGAGIFRSDDYGVSWTSAGTDSRFFEVNALVRNVNDVLFCGTNSCGIYRSVDDGESWTNVGGYSVCGILSLVSIGNDTLLAATYDGIKRTENAGGSWSPTGLSGVQLMSLVMTPSWELWAGGLNALYFSNTFGSSWTRVDSAFFADQGWVFALASYAQDTVFAGTSSGLFRTVDGGATWDTLETGIPTGTITALAVDSAGAVYAGTLHGMYRSTNVGASWSQVGPTNTEVGTIYVDRVGGSIFAGTEIGPFASVGGVTWNDIYTGTGLVATSITALHVDEYDSVFAGCGSSGISYSGWTYNWAPRNTGLDQGMIWDIEGRSDTIFAAMGPHVFSVYRSSDNGNNWEMASSGIEGKYVMTLYYDPNGGIIAGTYYNGVYTSSNNGDLWTQSDLDTGYINDIVSVSSGDLFAATGRSFSAARTGVYRSQDGGGTWESVGLDGAKVYGLAVDSINDYLYALSPSSLVTGKTDLWRSDIDNIVWTHASALPDSLERFNAVIVDTKGIVYVGGSPGVYYSGDHGASWLQVLSGVPVLSLAMDSRGDIYAGTGGDGVYWTPVHCLDADGDWICDIDDNCPYVFNPDQADADLDGHGDVCDPPSDSVEYTVVTGDVAGLYSSAVFDLDLDNYPDVVFSDPSQNAVAVSYGGPGGGLESPVTLLSVGPAVVTIDFLNSDTLPDVAIATTDTVYILFNLGNRVYSTAAPTLTGLYGLASLNPDDADIPALTSGYFNDDEILDLVVAPNEIHLGLGDGSFSAPVILPFDFQAANVCDFNHDGKDDLAVLSGDQVRVYLNDGGTVPSFTQGSSTTIGLPDLQQPLAHVVTDFDEDGFCDFALVTPLTSPAGQSAVTVIFWERAGGVTKVLSIPVQGVSYELTAADPNRDGHLDIIVANGTESRLEIYFGDGTGYFSEPQLLPLTAGTDLTYALATLDLDRDGNPDFVSGSVDGGDVQLAYNDNVPDPIIEDDAFFPMVTTGYSGILIEVVNPGGFVISRYFRTVAGSEFERVDVNSDGLLDQLAVDYNVQFGRYTVVIKGDPGSPGGSEVTCGIRIDGSQQHEIFSNYLLGELKSAATDDDSIVFYYDVEPTSSVFPENGGTMNATSPTFQWAGLVPEGLEADSFHFQLDCYHDFRSSPSLRYDIRDVTDPQVTVAGSLGVDSIFYWRVRWYADGIWSEFSHAFAAKSIIQCCGQFTFGFTGNTDCDPDGTMNLQDITRLIDHIYLSQLPLCCEENGNTNGDDRINLQDITRLIDHIYLSKNPTAVCP